jgi:gliding motility-associated-like protein
VNGSFNGRITDKVPPVGWSNCSDSLHNNSPDVLKNYTFSKGNTKLYPVKDSTFLLIRARGANYAENYTNSFPRTHEYISQKLTRPLNKNICYKFTAYLCTDLNMQVRDRVEPNKSYPLILKVWGSNRECTREKVLFESDPVNYTFWEKKEFNFGLVDTSYSNILIDVMWDTINIKNEPYNGLIFIDDIKIDSTGPIDTSRVSTVYFKGLGKTILEASKGDSYQWIQRDNLSQTDSQSTAITKYSDRYSVLVEHKNSCPEIELFNIKIDCSILYPKKLSDTFNVYYNPRHKVVLNAGVGKNFNWEPQTDLSDFHIQSPYLIGHTEDYYIASITDEHNCLYQEKFNILYNCDTIVSKKSFTVFDTVLTNHATITLIPSYGTINGYWSPNEWLSCIECQEPTSNPLNAVTYSVKLKDEYNCLHQENFKIGVELYVPNVITPNGDGFNDCFKIFGLPEATIVNIYDKSGRLVFNSNSYNESNCWDGRDMVGKQLETGTYWYSLNQTNAGLFKKGFVFVKR